MLIQNNVFIFGAKLINIRTDAQIGLSRAILSECWLEAEKKKNKMATNSISVQSLKDATNQEISIHKFIGSTNNDVLYEKSAHRRDDHFLFIFQRKGRSKIVLDFKEIELDGGVVLCVLPGQVHYTKAVEQNTEAWLITLDTRFVSNDYRAIFEKNYFQQKALAIGNIESRLLNDCIELILSSKENKEQLNMIPQVTASLIDGCVGMFASVYKQSEEKESVLSRKHIITQQFKHLLLLNYNTHKSTSDYAAMLNITPAYLNEVLKQITGLTVSFWIQQMILTEAKRLLYATDKTVKEIAYHLGFEDQAYFTRYFSNAEGQAPLQFRLQYRK